MLAYQIRIAWLSLRRNPVLSLLMVSGIALGIAVSTAFVTAFLLTSGDPIPHKSDRLYHVQMDAWSPNSPFDSDRPEEPPDQLTWMDAMAATASDIPTHQSPMFKANLTLYPPRPDERPYRASARLCRGDFFRLFDPPFQYGGPWDAAADRDAEPVVVLDHATNLRLFGGEDSVGESIEIEDRRFTVVGVLAPWLPAVKFYDLTQDDFEAPEAIYLPIAFTEPMEIATAGNLNGWKFTPGNTYADLLASETTWLQAWVQLDDAEQVAAYQAYLDAYVREQKRVGRFGRPLNNRLRTVTEWNAQQEVVPEESRAMLVISLLFLVVCAVNLIGILLGKFLARAPEIGVRRALGASRASVFMQHIIECELIALLGGALGIGLSVVTMEVTHRWIFGTGIEGLALDAGTVGIGVALSLAAGLIAGIYPSWRICRMPPAVYLKQQ